MGATRGSVHPGHMKDIFTKLAKDPKVLLYQENAHPAPRTRGKKICTCLDVKRNCLYELSTTSVPATNREARHNNNLDCIC